MNDRLQQMMLFVSVADSKGFSATARQHQISTAAVTRAVSALEERLGARLLHRTTRRVDLTEAGARFLLDSRRLLQEMEEAEHAAAGLHAEPRGTLTITASVMFGRQHITPLLYSFLDRYPEVSVRTLFVDRVVNLLDEGADVAIRVGELPDSGLRSLPVGRVQRCIVAAPGYLKSHGTPQHPRDLATHACIQFTSLTPGTHWSFRDTNGVIEVPIHARLQTNSPDCAIRGALDGRGLVGVFNYYIADEIRSGQLIPVLDAYAPPHVPVSVLHREGSQVSAKVRAMVDHISSGLKLRLAPL